MNSLYKNISKYEIDTMKRVEDDKNLCLFGMETIEKRLHLNSKQETISRTCSRYC